MFRAIIISVIIVLTCSAGDPSRARLLRQPDISRDSIAFIYAGDLWTALRRRRRAQAHHHTGSRELPEILF